MTPIESLYMTLIESGDELRINLVNEIQSVIIRND